MSATSPSSGVPSANSPLSVNTVVTDLVHFLTHPMRFVHNAHSAASIRSPQVQKFLDNHSGIIPSVSTPPSNVSNGSIEEDRRTKFIRCIVAMARCVNTTKKNPKGAAIVSMSDDELEQLFSKLHQALVTATQVAQQQMQQQMQQQQQQQTTTTRRPVTRSTSKSTDSIPDDLIMDCIAFVVDGAEEVLSQLNNVDLHFLRMQTILLQLLLCAGERVLPMLLSNSEYVSKWITPLLKSVCEMGQQGETGRTVLQIYAAHTLRFVSFMINRYEMCVIIARNAFHAERETRRLEGKSRKGKKSDGSDLGEKGRRRRELEEKYGELIDDKDDLDMFDKDRMEKERQKRLALEKARELEEELRLQKAEGGDNDTFDEDSDETLRAMRDTLFTISFTEMLVETIVSNVWPDEDDLIDVVDVYSFVLERSAALLAISALQELLHAPKIEYRRVEVCLMYAKSAVGARMIPAIFDSVSANTQGPYKRDMVSTTLEIFSSIAQTVVCCNALEESGSTEAAVNLLIRLTFGDEYSKNPPSSPAMQHTITETPEERDGEEEEEEERADAEESGTKPTPFIAEHSNHFLNHAISVVCYVIGMSGCNYKKIAKRLHSDISLHEHDEHALLRALMVQLKRAAFVPNIPEDPSSNFKLTVYSALASILLHADVEEIFKLDEQEQLRLASLIAIDLQVSAKGSYYEQPTRTGTGLFSSPWVQYYGAVSLLHVILEKISGDERASPFLRKLLDSNALSLLKNVAIDWKKPKHLRNTQQKDPSKPTESANKGKSRRVRGAARRKPAVDLDTLRAQIAAKKKAEAVARTDRKSGGAKKSKSKKHEKEIEMVDESEHEEDEKREDNIEEVDEESDIDENGDESEEEEEEEEEDNEPYVPGQDEPYYFKYWVQPSQLALNALVQALKKDTDEVNVAKAAEQFDEDRSLVKLIRGLEQSIEKQRPSESTSSFKDLRWILYLVVVILVLPYIYRVLRPMLRG